MDICRYFIAPQENWVRTTSLSRSMDPCSKLTVILLWELPLTIYSDIRRNIMNQSKNPFLKVFFYVCLISKFRWPMDTSRSSYAISGFRRKIGVCWKYRIFTRSLLFLFYFYFVTYFILFSLCVKRSVLLLLYDCDGSYHKHFMVTVIAEILGLSRNIKFY